MKKILLVVVLLMLAGQAWADNIYWVSPTGAASWASSESDTPLSGTACTTVALAFANADDDDIVYFRGGTYTVPQKNFGDWFVGYYTPTNSGSSGHYITFQAYTGETPIFNGTTGGSGDDPGVAAILGTENRSYIIFDGFTFEADSGTALPRVNIGSDADNSSYITMQNCSWIGSHYAGTDNRDGLRIEGTVDTAGTNHITISRCYFEKFRETTQDYHNVSAIKMYHTSYVTIENCEFYDNTVAIYSKSQSTYQTFRYNFIHTGAVGIHVATESYYQTHGEVYHNIITDCYNMVFDIYGQDGYDVDYWSIYNNTFYYNGTVEQELMTVQEATGSTQTGYYVYNNIFQGAGGGGYGNVRFRVVNGVNECDYNNYGSSMSVRNCDGSNYTTPATLRAATLCGLTANNHDMHSIAADPAFVTASGARDTIAEFALQAGSPCKGTGKSGVDIGADITLVGVDAGSGEDTTPDQFTFTDIASADRSTVYTSNQITIAGINASASVSITGGTYSKNGGAYTNSSGTCVNGDTFTVRHTSSASFSTATNTVLTVGGVSDTYTTTTLAEDTTPTAFSFTDIANAAISTQYTSNQITILGINSTATVTITGGTYSKNGGTYTASAGTCVSGDTFTVRHTSSASFSTATNTVLTVGGVSDTYTTTTLAADTTPDSFFFTDITGASLSTQYTSNQITVIGINTTANVSVSGGTYSKNGAAYTSGAGTCVLNDTFTVRHTSSANYFTDVNTTLTIGGVSDTYTTTTITDTTPPGTPLIRSLQLINAVVR